MALAAAGPAGAAALAGAGTSHIKSPAGSAAASWKVVKTVRGANFPDFTAVTATGGDGAWAFESTSTARALLRPYAWRLASGRWSRAPFPGRPGERVLSASATSPSNVWALAFSGKGARALLWNGSSWSVTGTFTPGASPGDVVALSRADAWAFGAPGGAWHFNGHRWSLLRSGRGLVAGSGLSPDSVWAIGGTDVAHWNGHTWSRTSVQALLPLRGKLNSPWLTSIYAQSPTSVWAVGTAGQESQGGPVAVLHYNGHRWTRAALADVCCGFPGQVIPDGTGGLWVPYGIILTNSYEMLHYAGGRVGQVILPVPAGMTLQLASAAAVPGQPRAFAVGGAFPAGGPEGGHTRAVILASGS